MRSEVRATAQPRTAARSRQRGASRDALRQELAEKEQRFLALVENLSDVIVLADAQGIFTFDTPPIERVLGYQQGEVLGDPFMDYIHPDDREHVGQVFAAILAAPRQPHSVETRIRHADGRWRWVDAVGVNLLDDPAVGAVVGNFRDVTERKLAQEAEVSRAAMLARERDRIAMELHDGVIQSLYGVVLGLGAARRGADPAESVGQAIDQLNKVISDIREYIYQLRPASQPELDLAAALRLLAQELFSGASTVCELDLAPLPALPGCLSREVLQIAREALSNVRRHAGSPRVRISPAAAGGIITLAIADDGAGFDPRGLCQAGQGLSNMAGRAAAIDGVLEVSSQPGAGTVVCLIVPAPGDHSPSQERAQ